MARAAAAIRRFRHASGERRGRGRRGARPAARRKKTFGLRAAAPTTATSPSRSSAIGNFLPVVARETLRARVPSPCANGTRPAAPCDAVRDYSQGRQCHRIFDLLRPATSTVACSARAPIVCFCSRGYQTGARPMLSSTGRKRQVFFGQPRVRACLARDCNSFHTGERETPKLCMK